MKIIVIGPQPPIRGGIADTNKELCTLLNQNNDIIAVSFSRLYPGFFFKGKKEKMEEKMSYEKKEMLDALNPFSWYHTLKYIESEKPDRVIFHWWTTYLFPCYYFLSHFLSKKITKGVLIHNVFPHGEGGN